MADDVHVQRLKRRLCLQHEHDIWRWRKWHAICIFLVSFH